MPKKLTTNIFKEKAIKIHGNFYDYSEVKYKNLRTKVKIICPEHGAFMQYAGNHLDGHKCVKCSVKKVNDKRTNTYNFIKKAYKIHGNRFDYSEVNYVNAYTDIKIICRIHGHFYQKPTNHFNSKIACKKCVSDAFKIGGEIASRESFKKRKKESRIIQGWPLEKKKEFFFKRLRDSWGEKYDLSKVNFTSSEEKIEIICKKHGSYYIRAAVAHKYQCYKCGREAIREKTSLSKSEFISKAKMIHGEKYNYSYVKYGGMKKKVKILCNQHGFFYVTPNSHIHNKSICKHCSDENQKVSYKKFIEISNIMHKSRYDYSFVKTNNDRIIDKKIKIICPEHGEFQQNHNNHMRGSGCPICGNSIQFFGDFVKELIKKGYDVAGILYEIEIYNKEEHFYKIGITTYDTEKRYNGSNLLDNYEYEIINEFHTTIVNAFKIEQDFIKNNKDISYEPKHKFGGHTECFIDLPSITSMELRELFSIEG